MDRINWADFDGEKFQTFCNALLSFEISKKVDVFSTPGKDGGIDASYSGPYDGQKGKWRFQYKFHSTDRKQAVSLLKSQVAKDIFREVKGKPKSNVLDEDHVIFLTNVGLLPQDKIEIVNKAVESLAQVNKTKVHFDIWDREKLYTLYLRHPLLQLWVEHGFTAQLQDYKTFFKQQLHATSEDAYTLNNTFIARDLQLQQLDQFLDQDKPLVAAVTGEAGIGKTRLCIEFFKRSVDTRLDWEALVLVNHNIDFDKIKKALSEPGKNYVLFVDDAHNYDPKTLADIKQVVKLAKGNKIKLLLTARNIASYEPLRLLKEREEILTINLEKLDYEETKQLLKKELQGFRMLSYVDELTSLSRGRPILILAIIRAVKSQVRISEIRTANFLRDYVLNYFNQFKERLLSEHGIDKRQASGLINLFCLLEPINLSDKDLIGSISSNENIPIDSIEIIFKELKENSFITGKYEYSIKPDYYSDIVLQSAIQDNWLLRKTEAYPGSIANIIRNISSIEDIAPGDRKSILDQLLSDYIKTMDTASSYYDLLPIFQTIHYITQARPLIAIEALKHFISIFRDPQHALHNHLRGMLSIKNYTLDSRIIYINRILHDLTYFDEHLEDVYQLLVELYLLSGEKKMISAVFGFERIYYNDEFTCRKQLFLAEKIKEILDAGNTKLAGFALDCCEVLLPLTYTVFGSSSFNSSQITITTIAVPENKYSKKLRITLIDALVKYYLSNPEHDHAEKCFKLILDIPREILSQERKGKGSYKGYDEIKKVLAFINDILKGDLSIGLKDELVERVYWYKKWGMDKRFHSTLESITASLEPRNLTEELVSLFTYTLENIDLENIDSDKVFSEKSNALIKANSPDRIAESLIDIHKNYPSPPHYFYDFNSIIYRQHPKMAEELLEALWKKDKSYVLRYGSSYLKHLYFYEGQNSFYWKFSDRIFKLNTAEAFNCLLHVYSFLSHDKEWTKISSKDTELIARIYEAQLEGTEYQMAFALPTLFHVDEEQAVILIREFLNKCNQREADHIFHAFRKLPAKYYAHKKKMLLADTIRFSISHEIEQGLKEVIRTDGFKDVANYLIKRFEYKTKIVSRDKTLLGYEVCPKHDTGHLLSGLDEAHHAEYYQLLLEWYIKKSYLPLETLYSKDLLEYIRPSKHITPELYEMYSKAIAKHRDKYPLLRNLVSTLEIFKRKNEAMVDLVVQAIEAASSFTEEQKKAIASACYSALTTAGVKHGTPGEPFSFDLELEQLLINAVDHHKDKPRSIISFFETILKHVQKDIREAKEERGGEEW